MFRARLVVSLYEQKPKHEKQGQSIKGALMQNLRFCTCFSLLVFPKGALIVIPSGLRATALVIDQNGNGSLYVCGVGIRPSAKLGQILVNWVLVGMVHIPKHHVD